MVLGQPRFCFRGIKKVLFDRWFEGKRCRKTIEFVQIIGMLRIMRGRSRNAQLLCEPVSISFIPNPLNAFPLRRGNTEHLTEFRSVVGEGSNEFLTCGVKYPSMQVQPPRDFD